jgi:H+-translocating NAD(P) transhydrogenase subunit alpha
VDLAAERGGNCELTKANETVVVHGVHIMGPTNLPATVPYHASQMFAHNVAGFLGLLIDEGELKINLEDEIVRGTLVTQGGEVVNEQVREAMESKK